MFGVLNMRYNVKQLHAGGDFTTKLDLKKLMFD